MKNLLLFSGLLFIQLFSQAQYNSDSTEANPFSEDKIEELCFGVLNAEQDAERKQFNQSLKRLLTEELSKPAAFSFPFEKIESIGIFSSPDSILRIFNWMVPFTDGSYQYESLVLLKVNDEVNLIELNSLPADSTISEDKIYRSDSWPGALYYKLIQTKDKFRTYYTLLGWEGHNRLTTIKYIDVITIDQLGKLKFGAPVFEKDNRMKMRRKFEFSAQHSMKLNYHQESEQIRFDYLAPLRSDLEGLYEYYFPAMTQDAYKWDGSKWEFIKLIDSDEGHKREKKQIEKSKKDILIKEQTPIYQTN